MADLRGTGQSTGCLDHLGPRDQKDSKDLIKWIADQKWSNGRVGMTGHSYVGSTPSMAAAQNPRALKTIVPSAGLAAMYHHKFQTGVPYFLQWVGPAEAYEELAINRYLLPQLGDAYGDNFGEDYEWFGCGLPNSALISGDEFEAGVYDDAEPFPWDAERDSRKGAQKSDIPTFGVHGVNDNAARIPALDWFRKRRNPRDKAWIGQWDHGSNFHPNDRTCAQHAAVQSCTNDQWTLALHAWFDKHLKKKDIRTGPKVEVFLNNRTVYQPSDWPARKENRWRRFWFGADGKLLRKKPEEAGSATYVASPDGFGNEYSADGEFGTNALAWTSAPVKKSILLAGIPTAKIFEAQTVERLHLITTLYDIAPNGDVVCVRVTPKVTSTERCGISKGTFAMNPELRGGIREITPVVPGEVMKLRMTGMDQAYVLKKGHKLRVVVASSQPDKVPTHAEGSVTVHWGGDDASRVALPVVHNARLRTDAFHKS
jgi:putative CocE/NonD family hydrolase